MIVQGLNLSKSSKIRLSIVKVLHVFFYTWEAGPPMKRPAISQAARDGLRGWAAGPPTEAGWPVRATRGDAVQGVRGLVIGRFPRPFRSAAERGERAEGRPRNDGGQCGGTPASETGGDGAEAPAFPGGDAGPAAEGGGAAVPLPEGPAAAGG